MVWRLLNKVLSEMGSQVLPRAGPFRQHSLDAGAQIREDSQEWEIRISGIGTLYCEM